MIPVIYSAQGNQNTKVAESNFVKFTVSTLKVDPHGDIKDVKQPLRISLNWLIILIWILAGLIVIAAGIWIYWYYKKKQAEKAGIVKVIKRKPHETALNSLREIEGKKLWQNGYIKQFHTEITEVIRRYYEERYRIPALELTTSELLQKLSNKKESQKILDITSGFLTNADMVKFAKFIPMDDINNEMMKQAYEIVEKTMPVVVEENEAENV